MAVEEKTREQVGAELCQAQDQLGLTRLAMVGYVGLLPAVLLLFRSGGWVVGLMKNKTKLSPARASLLGLSLAKSQ